MKSLRSLLEDSKLGENPKLLPILVFFGLYFAVETFLCHHNFHTASDTYGIYTNALYDYAHFRRNYCTLLTPLNSHLETPYISNKLSDHFSVIQFAFAPLIYVFGTYTLSVIQYSAILFGGVGLWRFFRRKAPTAFEANLALIFFFSFWAITTVLGCDYHDNVVAAMFFPWLYMYLDRGKWSKVFFFTVLMLSCKETVAFWLVFVFLSWAIFNLTNRKTFLFSLSLITLTTSWFLLVTKVVMPLLADSGRQYLHFHYSALGESYSEAIAFMFTHPIETMKLLFVNHTGSPYGDGIKLEFHYMALVCGGIVVLVRPKFALMVLPLYGMKLLNDQFEKWGICYHYSIEFAPIFAVGLFTWIMKIKQGPRRKGLAFGFVLATITMTVLKLNHRESKWYNRDATNIFRASHYKRDFSIREAHRALDAHIPEGVPVSAQASLVPHLALRDFIYEFPTLDQSQYVVWLEDEGTYPLEKEDYQSICDSLKAHPNWDIVYEKNNMVILAKQ